MCNDSKHRKYILYNLYDVQEQIKVSDVLQTYCGDHFTISPYTNIFRCINSVHQKLNICLLHLSNKKQTKMKGIYGDKEMGTISRGGYCWEHSQENSVQLLCSTSILTCHSTSEPFLESSTSHDLHCPDLWPHLNSLWCAGQQDPCVWRNERKDKSPIGSSDTTVVLLYVNEPLPQNFHSLLIQNFNFLCASVGFHNISRALTMGKDIVSMGKCIPIFNNLLKLLNFYRTQPFLHWRRSTCFFLNGIFKYL